MVERPNIIFIVVDTVRADMLDVYGGAIKTKTLSAIAKNGAVYENAIAPGTYTVPSHTSIFLNKRVMSIPSMRRDMMKHSDEATDPFLVKSRYISENELTLAGKMSYLGYNTALFSNNPFLSKTTGLANGFGYVDNIWFRQKIDKNRRSVKLVLKLIESDKTRKRLIRLAYAISKFLPEKKLDELYLKLRVKLNIHFSNEYGYYELDKGAGITNKRISRYMAHSSNKSNFMLINYMEAHEGYPTNLVADGYTEQDKWLYMSGLADRSSMSVIKKAYSKRVSYLDGKLSGLLSALKKSGVLDNAVLIIAGDHGQAFMEHGVMYHNIFPYSEVVRVPLITAKFENGKQVSTKERVGNTVSLSALHNSILDIGYGKSDIIDGNLRSGSYVFSDHVGITEVWDKYLLDMFKGRSKYARTILNTKRFNNSFATAVYNNGLKLIHFHNGAMKDMMFNVSDTAEQENIIDQHRREAHTMLRAASA